MATNDISELEKLYATEKKTVLALTKELYLISIENLHISNPNSDLINRHLALNCSAKTDRSTIDHLLFNNRSLLSTLAFDKMQNEIKSSKETLDMLKRKKSNLLEKKAALTNHLIAENKLLSIVKLEQLNNTSHLQSGENLSLDDFKRKYAAVRKLKSLRMSQLSEFLAKHFPIPTQEEMYEHDIFQFQNPPRMISLAAIIEILVNKYMEHGKTDWMTIEPTMWLPHVELLLRLHIAVRSKFNPSRIRLQDFTV